MKKALKIIGLVHALLVLTVAIYVAYVLIAYHRIGNQQLVPENATTTKAVETETFPVDEETNSIFEPQEPVWQNTPSTTFTFAPDPQPHLAGNYNNDEDFNNMVNTPTIVRDRMNTVQSQSRVMVEEEPVSAVYYELKDDVNDVFHGFAD